ncbi:unnamed protein product, partial [Prorocentrum cordatum]
AGLRSPDFRVVDPVTIDDDRLFFGLQKRQRCLRPARVAGHRQRGKPEAALANGLQVAREAGAEETGDGVKRAQARVICSARRAIGLEAWEP